jgi:hypothetical protein
MRFGRRMADTAVHLEQSVLPRVPIPPAEATANTPPPAPGDQLELLGDTDDAPARRKRWAWLLAHVFPADAETCPCCSGPMRWAEVANTRAQITRLLAEHGPWSASATGRARDGVRARAVDVGAREGMMRR